MKRIKSTRYLICTFAIVLLSLKVVLADDMVSNPQTHETKTVSASIYFAVNESARIDSVNYLELGRLVFQARRYQDAPIVITGWADGTGNEQYNMMLSAARAATAKRYLVKEGIDGSRITYSGMGIDTDISKKEARRATITMEIVVEPKKTVVPKAPVVVESEPEVESPALVEETVVSKPVVSEPVVSADGGKFALRTNLLYWLGASINAGIEWNPSGTSMGVILNGGYAPLGHDHWKRNMGGWFVSPEVRWYLGSAKQWFVGAELLVGGYNFKMGEQGYQGYTVAGGVTGGYKIELSQSFDMDFSLGLGYGTLKYDQYYHCDEYGINVLQECGVQKNTIMPIQVGVSLIWKIR